MEQLSKANAELVDLKDADLCAALLEHWGYYCHIKTFNNGKYVYRFINRINGEFFGHAIARSRERIIEIINDHTDPETGVLIL